MSGQRKTQQREAIRRALEEARRPLTPHEVLERAQDRVPNLGIATVYRNLKFLVSDGTIQPVELPGEPTRYERSDRTHHHHFQCTACGRVFDVPGCSADVETTGLEGFRVDDHRVTLLGRCPECL